MPEKDISKPQEVEPAPQKDVAKSEEIKSAEAVQPPTTITELAEKDVVKPDETLTTKAEDKKLAEPKP
uniref:Uncharacterized protein n=1 Tax=Panagrolaimus sp. PS1159 TaxID=55785 RepID=A0AC35G0U3_9BILA